MFGQDFRRQFWADILLGALFLLVCRGIANLLPWIGYQPFPISFIINIVIPPILAVAMAKGKRSWE
jgi:ABC-type Fe3+-siderophore transport system permease subunit